MRRHDQACDNRSRTSLIQWGQGEGFILLYPLPDPANRPVLVGTLTSAGVSGEKFDGRGHAGVTLEKLKKPF